VTLVAPRPPTIDYTIRIWPAEEAGTACPTLHGLSANMGDGGRRGGLPTGTASGRQTVGTSEQSELDGVDENSQERMTETAARRGLTRGNARAHEAPSRLDSRTTLGSASDSAFPRTERDSFISASSRRQREGMVESNAYEFDVSNYYQGPVIGSAVSLIQPICRICVFGGCTGSTCPQPQLPRTKSVSP
jgi:hypothetical protein